jgi:hypothetical protein
MHATGLIIFPQSSSSNARHANSNDTDASFAASRIRPNLPHDAPSLGDVELAYFGHGRRENAMGESPLCRFDAHLHRLSVRGSIRLVTRWAPPRQDWHLPIRAEELSTEARMRPRDQCANWPSFGS